MPAYQSRLVAKFTTAVDATIKISADRNSGKHVVSGRKQHQQKLEDGEISKREQSRCFAAEVLVVPLRGSLKSYLFRSLC